MLNKPLLSLGAPSQRSDKLRRRTVQSQFLFGPAVEVVIEHNGQEYRLRRTRNGKLILNK